MAEPAGQGRAGQGRPRQGRPPGRAGREGRGRGRGRGRRAGRRRRARPAERGWPAPQAGSGRHQTQPALLRHHHGQTGPLGRLARERPHALERTLVGSSPLTAQRGDGLLGPQALLAHPPCQPGCDPVDQQRLVRGYAGTPRVVAFDRAPAGGAARTVALDPLGHFGIGPGAGGQVAHGLARRRGDPLGHLALAAADATEHQHEGHQPGCQSWGWKCGTATAASLCSKPGRATRCTHRSQFMRGSPSIASW